MERTVCPGEFYRHFKNRLYQVIAVARHSETGERMVVYQALYGDYQIYVRPYDMFISPVDREKYPQAAQEYRFERVTPGGQEEMPSAIVTPEENAEEEQPNPALLKFLDSDSFEEKMECLRSLSRTASQRDIDSICTVLDIRLPKGGIAEQVAAIERYLKLQNHFDGTHLR